MRWMVTAKRAMPVGAIWIDGVGHQLHRFMFKISIAIER